MHTFKKFKKPELWAIHLLCFILLFASCDPNDDLIHLDNASTDEVGLLVDGVIGGTHQNDFNFTTTIGLRNVGIYTGAGINGEIVAFNNAKPVAIKNPQNWTSGRDEPHLAFDNIISIPVKVWIVKGNFSPQRTRAINHCIYTSNVWGSERMGVRFSPFEIVDATGDPDASSYYNFTCSMKGGLQNDIGRDPNKINIYYLGTVDGGSSRGQACSIGSDFVAMGENTLSDLLVHELGHDFNLFHTDTNVNFNVTGIMASGSSSRAFISEGQLFRAHLLPGSAINAVYNARSGKPTRSCGHNTSSVTCPTISKRIWSDGSFPSN